MVTTADGYAEREAAKVMIKDAKQVAGEEAQITLGADKGYDTAEFIEALTEMKVLPHVAQNTSNRRSAVPDHIAATDGYVISQQKRKLIEQGFGWAKFIGPIRQVMVRGLKKVDQLFVLTMAAYNLTRMRTLEQSVCRRRRARKTMKNDLNTAGNRPKKGLVFQIAKSVSEYSTHVGGKVGFADQYFSSLLESGPNLHRF